MVIKRIVNSLPRSVMTEAAAALFFVGGFAALVLYAVVLAQLWPWTVYVVGVVLSQLLLIPIWIMFAVAFELRILAVKKSSQ